MITIQLNDGRADITVQLDTPATPADSAQAIKDFYAALDADPATAPPGR